MEKNKKTEDNILYGIVGALIGSLLGTLLIVLLSSVGVVASIVGFVMATLTIKCYTKFAGGLSKKGIFICIIVMVIMTLIAENVAFTIRIMIEGSNDSYFSNFFYILKNFYSLLSKGIINKGVYYSSLILLYLFNIIGAFTTIKSSYDDVKDLD